MLRLKSLIALIFVTTFCVAATCNDSVHGQASKALSEKQILELINLDLESINQKLDDTWKAYNQQLQAIVKTRLTEEKRFVGQIVVLIQEEHIPKNLVDSAWMWVRNNRPGTLYPFVYFEQVLRFQARKAKIVIPPFDRRIYSDTNARHRRIEQEARRILQQKNRR